ncbi:MAG: phage tail protein [Croceibacterium sp.]
MATLVFTALGTAIGGPLGGAVGALIGNQLDRAVIGGGKREGPRLKELAITTSSYGMPVARQFGTMRVPGTIIWATDIVESSEKTGGHKGSPSTKTYSYSASFAVALASRPIQSLGRIWADGNLLRGAAGDLKAGGKLRLYTGHGDQPADPLIASARGGTCPGFRGFAYCVFESLQLADFGNRIPALSFEVTADGGTITLAQVLAPLDEPVDATRPLAGLVGLSDEGGPLAGTLAAIDQLYPLACDAGGTALSIASAEVVPGAPVTLPPATVDESDGSFGAAAGKLSKRVANAGEIPQALRFYDIDRDYQAGVQHAEGRARPGRNQTIEFAGAFAAGTARALVNAAAERAGWARETLAWRVSELDPAVVPGSVVRVPDQSGLWRIESWEWRERGIELELRRLPATSAGSLPAEPGESLPKPDLVAGPTALVAFELPWDGMGAGDSRQAYAAVSSAAAGWPGAALYLDQAGELVPLGASGSRRSVIGELASPAPGSCAVLIERSAAIDVTLLSPDFQLTDATAEGLAQGANRAVLGEELIQFAGAVRIAGGHWRLTGLLRGRGGTESAAKSGHDAGTPFVLLDGAPVPLDPALLGRTGEAVLSALGLADAEPVAALLIAAGASTRPLTPVHPARAAAADGTLTLGWTRRARGAWTWPDGIDAPLGEEAERYLAGIGNVDAPAVRWDLTEPRLDVPAALLADLSAAHPGQPLWVRQVGSFGTSPALLLTMLA